MDSVSQPTFPKPVQFPAPAQPEKLGRGHGQDSGREGKPGSAPPKDKQQGLAAAIHRSRQNILDPVFLTGSVAGNNIEKVWLRSGCLARFKPKFPHPQCSLSPGEKRGSRGEHSLLVFPCSPTHGTPRRHMGGCCETTAHQRPWTEQQCLQHPAKLTASPQESLSQLPSLFTPAHCLPSSPVGPPVLGRDAP